MSELNITVYTGADVYIIALLNQNTHKGNKMTTQNLKDAMIDLYNKKDAASESAYRMAFDLLEAKIGEDKLDQFLDAYGM